MTVHFTSDTHFDHSKVIEYCDRPFKDRDDMNEALISNWNSVVDPDDTVYHCGDFAFSNQSRASWFTARLNGKKHLITGNHDRRIQYHSGMGWESVNPYLEVTIEKQSIVLFHYAMRVWNRSHYGAWQLYGHSHGSLPDDPTALSLDVGVDVWNYHPVSFEDLKRAMNKKTWKPKDHHGKKS
jgi:calcineurin-like phosphoesterase family protein